MPKWNWRVIGRLLSKYWWRIIGFVLTKLRAAKRGARGGPWQPLPTTGPGQPSIASAGDHPTCTYLLIKPSDIHSSANIYSMEVTSNGCLSGVRSFLSSPSRINTSRNLQGDEARTFIDFLDQGLAACSPLDDKYLQRGSLLLSKICKARSILPASYILREEVHIGRHHYSSGHADVFEGIYLGSSVAVKRLQVNRGGYARDFKRFCREVIGWKRLTHPNIFPLLGVVIDADKNRLEILTKWMPNGSIMDYAKSNPEDNRLRMLSDVMSGVCYLHRLRVVHGDLKGANILIDLVGDTATARVTDFGLIAMADSSTNLLSATFLPFAGTHRWMSPELLDPSRFSSNGRQTRESDCYALGMVIYEVLTGHPPFYHMRAFSPVTAVLIDGVRPEKPPNAKSLGFSDALWELVQSCWSVSVPTRPTAEQLSNELSAAVSTWVPPPVYPTEVDIDIDNDTISTDSSGLLRMHPTDITREMQGWGFDMIWIHAW
ncbi:kinase-like domain-containing protein [Thelephora terrestris]|uniref:Kinase-like domain-containing protein n=1 Tax=Thelephora terrestris TaxID=56493 RepID=A0A9P6HK73_9AGAM|nr:kinase-like domain-containing protein [Thelephora terrestris]